MVRLIMVSFNSNDSVYFVSIGEGVALKSPATTKSELIRGFTSSSILFMTLDVLLPCIFVYNGSSFLILCSLT